MKANIVLDFFLSAKSEKSKEKIINKIKENIDHEFGAFVSEQRQACFQIQVYCESWEAVVYRVLRTCQSFGRKWVVTGDIDFEFSAWTNDSKLVGVESIGVSVDNPMYSRPS